MRFEPDWTGRCRWRQTRQRPHRGNHPRRDVSRCGLANPDPLQAVDRVSRSRSAGSRTEGRLAPVMVDDLAEELDFARAGRHRVPRASASISPAGRMRSWPRSMRDDAEGAELVAALDDRHVGLERIDAPLLSEAGGNRDVLDQVDDGAPSDRGTARRPREHRQAPDVLRADDDVGRVRALEDAIPFLLRDAARDGDDRPGPGFDLELAARRVGERASPPPARARCRC